MNDSLCPSEGERRDGDRWHEKSFDVLLQAAATSMRRARYVFVIIVIAGVLIVTAQFNATVPWIRHVLVRSTTKPEIVTELEVLRFRDLSIVRIPLLGLTFSVYDLAILGTLGMAVLSVWFFYTLRRENLSVGSIVAQAKAAATRGRLDQAVFLWYGVAHEFVYTTSSERDCPVGKKPRRSARLALRILQYMPAWVPVIIIGADLFTVFVPHKLYTVTKIGEASALWNNLGNPEKIEVLVRTLIAAVFGFFSLVQCSRAVRFDQDTREEIDELENIVKSHLPEYQQLAARKKET